MKSNLFSRWPYYSFKEINSVNKILKSGKVNYLGGTFGNKFEKKFSKFIGMKYGVALSNGTVALEIALKSLNITKNDEVIVTPRSYFTSASSIVKVNAKPIFTDIDINSQNIDIEAIKKNISNKTKAIICVHLGGFPCDMIEILKIAKKFNLFVIEDCSQSHGAKIQNKFVGSFGDISTWSFCNDKIISTGGEGGMILTNKKNIFNFIWSYKDQGKNYNKYFKKNPSKIFKYTHDMVGSNFRLTEMQSAIGIIQLNNLNKTISIRNKYAKMMTKTLKPYKSIITQNTNKELLHAYYRYYFLINDKYLKNSFNRNKIIKIISNYGIECGSGSCPEIYNETSMKIFKPKNLLKNSIFVGKQSIALNLHHNLKLKEVKYICKLIDKVMKKVTK